MAAMNDLPATLEVQRTLVLVLAAAASTFGGIARDVLIGGGIVRDVLLAEVPVVLRSELYAVAALAGAAIVAAGQVLHVLALVTAVCGGLVCVGLRIVALRRGWHLPRPPE